MHVLTLCITLFFLDSVIFKIICYVEKKHLLSVSSRPTLFYYYFFLPGLILNFYINN